MKNINEKIKAKHRKLKKWVLRVIALEFLHHANFGRWGGYTGLFLTNLLPFDGWLHVLLNFTGIAVGVSSAAFGKEYIDFWDYKGFSWKDIRYTYIGGIEVIICYTVILIAA